MSLLTITQPDVDLDTRITPATSDGSHDLFTHIIDQRESGPLGASYVGGTPVRALCGKVWVPSHNPRKHQLCPECKDIATQKGWAIPT